MNASSKSKPLLRDRLLKLKAGVATHLSTMTSVKLAGTVLTPADLTALIQSIVDQLLTTDAARATFHEQVATARALTAKSAPVLRALEQLARSMFADDAAALGDFGLAPPKARKLKAKDKAASVDKMLATKQRRHVMGSRQKKDEAKAPPPPAVKPIS